MSETKEGNTFGGIRSSRVSSTSTTSTTTSTTSRGDHDESKWGSNEQDTPQNYLIYVVQQLPETGETITIYDPNGKRYNTMQFSKENLKREALQWVTQSEQSRDWDALVNSPRNFQYEKDCNKLTQRKLQNMQSPPWKQVFIKILIARYDHISIAMDKPTAQWQHVLKDGETFSLKPVQPGDGSPGCVVLSDLLTHKDQIHDAFDKNRKKDGFGECMNARKKVCKMLKDLKKRKDKIQPISLQEKMSLDTFDLLYEKLEKICKDWKEVKNENVKNILRDVCKNPKSILQYYTIVSFYKKHGDDLIEQGIIISADRKHDAYIKCKKIHPYAICPGDRGAYETLCLLQTQPKLLNTIRTIFRLAAKNPNKTLILSTFSQSGQRVGRKDISERLRLICSLSQERAKCAELDSFNFRYTSRYQSAMDVLRKEEEQGKEFAIQANYAAVIGASEESERESQLYQRYQYMIDVVQKNDMLLFPIDFQVNINDHGYVHLDPRRLVFCETFIGVDMHANSNGVGTSSLGNMGNYDLTGSWCPNNTLPLVGPRQSPQLWGLTTTSAADPAKNLFRGGFPIEERRIAVKALNNIRRGTRRRSRGGGGGGGGGGGSSGGSKMLQTKKLEEPDIICQSMLLCAANGLYAQKIEFPKSCQSSRRSSVAMPRNVELCLLANPTKGSKKTDIIHTFIGTDEANSLAKLLGIRKGKCGHEDEISNPSGTCASGVGCACCATNFIPQDHMNCWSGQYEQKKEDDDDDVAIAAKTRRTSRFGRASPRTDNPISATEQNNRRRNPVNWCPCHGAYINNILAVIKDSPELYDNLESINSKFKEGLVARQQLEQTQLRESSSSSTSGLGKSNVRPRSRLSYLLEQMRKEGGGKDKVKVRVAVPKGESERWIKSYSKKEEEEEGAAQRINNRKRVRTKKMSESKIVENFLENRGGVVDRKLQTPWRWLKINDQYYFEFEDHLSNQLLQSANRDNLLPLKDIRVNGPGFKKAIWTKRLQASGTLPADDGQRTTAEKCNSLENNGLGICCTTCICQGLCIGNKLWATLGICILSDVMETFGAWGPEYIRKRKEILGLPITALISCVTTMQRETTTATGNLTLEQCFINILTESAQHLEYTSIILDHIKGGEENVDALWIAALKTMMPLLELDDEKEIRKMELYGQRKELESQCTFSISNLDEDGNVTFKWYDEKEFQVNYTELGRYDEIEGRPFKYRPGADGLYFYQPNDDIGVRVNAVLIPYNILASHVSKINQQEGNKLLKEGDDYNNAVALLEDPVFDSLSENIRQRLIRSGTGPAIVDMAKITRERLSDIFSKALIKKMAIIEREGAYTTGDAKVVDFYKYTGRDVCDGHGNPNNPDEQQLLWGLINYIIYQLHGIMKKKTKAESIIIAEITDVMKRLSNNNFKLGLDESIKLKDFAAADLAPIIETIVSNKSIKRPQMLRDRNGDKLWEEAQNLAIQCVICTKTYGDLHQLLSSLQILPSNEEEFMPANIIFMTGDSMGTALAATFKGCRPSGPRGGSSSSSSSGGSISSSSSGGSSGGSGDENKSSDSISSGGGEEYQTMPRIVLTAKGLNHEGKYPMNYLPMALWKEPGAEFLEKHGFYWNQSLQPDIPNTPPRHVLPLPLGTPVSSQIDSDGTDSDNDGMEIDGKEEEEEGSGGFENVTRSSSTGSSESTDSNTRLLGDVPSSSSPSANTTQRRSGLFASMAKMGRTLFGNRGNRGGSRKIKRKNKRKTKRIKKKRKNKTIKRRRKRGRKTKKNKK
jgi:hypothetical protein